MLEGRGGVAEREPAVQLQIVFAFGEGLDQQARAVERVHIGSWLANSIGSNSCRQR